MSLSSIYADGKFGLSFELYPPQTSKGESALLRHVEQLIACQPSFITCTYGAGGSTRQKTLEIISQIKRQFALPVASHLTCVGSTVDQLREYLLQAQREGVDHIVALRGDPPRGESTFQPPPGGLRYANELVSFIRGEFPQFGIAVAGYPETHQEAPSPETDLANLKRKVDAGAELVITQLFYSNDDFWRFRERYDRAGIGVPLVPGILPVYSLSQIQRLTSMCGATLPPKFVARLGEHDDPTWQYQVGVDFATQQVCELVQHQVPGLHFYVLNKSHAAMAVLKAAQQI